MSTHANNADSSAYSIEGGTYVDFTCLLLRGLGRRYDKCRFCLLPKGGVHVSRGAYSTEQVATMRFIDSALGWLNPIEGHTNSF